MFWNNKKDVTQVEPAPKQRSVATSFILSKDIHILNIPQWFIDRSVISSAGFFVFSIYAVDPEGKLHRLEWDDQISFIDEAMYVNGTKV